MNRLIFFILTAFFTGTAHAQFILERPDTPTHLLRKPSPVTPDFIVRSIHQKDFNELEKRARALSEILVAQYKGILESASRTENCETAPATVKALKISGRSSEALAFGEKCLELQVSQTGEQLELLFETAQAAVSEFKFKRALELYERASAKGFETQANFKLAVLEHANFAMRTEFQTQVQDILARGFDKEQSRIANGALELFFLGKTPLAKEPEIEAFVESLMTDATPRLRSWVHLNRVQHLDRNRYKYTETIEYLEKNVSEILDPSEWVDNAYSGFYHQSGTEEYRIAQIIYDAYLPYAHKFSWYPVETNTQNYTELYSNVCKETLAQDDYYGWLSGLRMRYLVGVDDLETSMAGVEAINAEAPNKSDVLDFLAHLYTRNGDDELAAAQYFESHKACAYYNRSHWGLTNIIRRKRHKAYSDYQKRLEIMNSEIAKLPAMNELTTYIMNWEGLDADARLRLKYSLRFWANHLDFLVSTKQKVYIKRGFELISFVPYMFSMRDVRVTYQGDNRLWDDIRGLGGAIVIVDLEEMTDGPFGVYNLAGHEVAHQFHHSLPEAITKCIETLYEAAKARGVFAEPYSATNSSEYFAQGVGYHMWPSDSPKRFGLNRQWLLDNDKDLDLFLTSVLEAKEIEEIRCPITVK
jgi:tetratricopeptide (TPR) repeat protein